MARVFRQQYTQRTPDGGRATRESAKWHVEYRDAQGIRRRVPGYTDKAATQQLASELERSAAREQSRLVDRFAVHRKRPLAEHLTDWRASLLAKSVTEKHAELTVRRASGRLPLSAAFVYFQSRTWRGSSENRAIARPTQHDHADDGSLLAHGIGRAVGRPVRVAGADDDWPPARIREGDGDLRFRPESLTDLLTAFLTEILTYTGCATGTVRFIVVQRWGDSHGVGVRRKRR